MARTTERPDGYTNAGVAADWHLHIKEGKDPFRERPGGLYDQIRWWVERNNLAWDNEIIDVCCGQGVTSVVAAKQGSLVTGVDISEPLIDIARQENRENTGVRFYTGDASNLYWIPDNSVDAGMMINGIFHLYPGVMEKAVSELARVTRGPILITNVAPAAYSFFASAFDDQELLLLEEDDILGPTLVTRGNPSVKGCGDTRLTLKDTPFVQHPMSKLKRAFDAAGLVLTDYSTFGPVSDVGGPDGLDLFAAIQLKHK